MPRELAHVHVRADMTRMTVLEAEFKQRWQYGQNPDLSHHIHVLFISNCRWSLFEGCMVI